MINLGQHILLDCYDCVNTDSDWDKLKEVFYKGLQEGNFTVLNDHHHTFEPHGISGVFILSESHLSLHIWTELNFISLDIYWCGKKCDEQVLVNNIIHFFNPKRIEYKYIDRGFFENQG